MNFKIGQKNQFQFVTADTGFTTAIGSYLVNFLNIKTRPINAFQFFGLFSL